MNRKLIKKTQELLSKEIGTVFKDPGGKITVALCYPNSYSVGMSSLGFQGIYSLLNDMQDVVCERAFLPDTDDIEEFRRTGTELFSFESRRPLSRFDMVAFSVSFENDYPNILKMLKLSRIPLWQRERDDRHPLLLMGGVCAFFNPEPLAEFFDVCFVGEAEEMLSEFLDLYRGASSRNLLFDKSLGIEGVYIPHYYTVEYADNGQIRQRKSKGEVPGTIRKRTVKNFSQSIMKTVITTPEAEFSDMCLLEVMRGCPWSCRFCLAGHIYRPPRRKTAGLLKKEIGEMQSRTKRVGLIGSSLSDYPYIGEILTLEGVDFSITSLRASLKSAQLVQMLRNHKSVSIAPEAGTERLRTIINKNITEEDILETAGLILESDIETLRLYFMIGLPTETHDDIEGIVALVKKVRAQNRKGFITLSVSTFVPKPFTPFQWHPMQPLKEIKEKIRLIKKGLSGAKGVRIYHDVPKYAYIQGLFSCGDRRVASTIEETAMKDTFGENRSSSSINRDFYIFRQKERNEILPWDFIDTGISKNALWKEYMKAVSP
jgi:radical SAM superfamily enzyme YgiQ (UPF0313 family)